LRFAGTWRKNKGIEDIVPAFTTADVCVLPSLFEGAPLALMEAMMSGMPIVTTATCGMKDVVEDGVTGLLVAIRSPAAIVKAVEALIADSGLRERIGRAAQRKALERYTWDRVAAPVKSVYERLVRRMGQ
jgi:glycosyltransferase involved in cell wall biosynthesis